MEMETDTTGFSACLKNHGYVCVYMYIYIYVHIYIYIYIYFFFWGGGECVYIYTYTFIYVCKHVNLREEKEGGHTESKIASCGINELRKLWQHSSSVFRTFTTVILFSADKSCYVQGVQYIK